MDTPTSNDAKNLAAAANAAGCPAFNPGLTSQKGEAFETRQTGTSKEDWIPNPNNRGVKLEKEREELVRDIIELYSGNPTAQRIRRYTADAVYDDPFSYANDRYQIAAQWFALPKIFDCKFNGHEVVRNDPELIQFKNSMTWTPKLISKPNITLNSLISLSLDPATVKSDFIQVKYHKDQADEKDYSHSGIKQKLKEWQAKGTAWMLGDERLKEFEGDFKGRNREKVNVYKD